MKGIFIGIAGGSALRCLDAVRDAVKKAAGPGRLAFGVCPKENTDPSPFFQAAGPASLRLMTGEGLAPKDAWQTVYSLYGGQDYALQITAEAVFMPDWDQRLLASLHQTDAQRPLLTSVLSPDGIPRAAAVRGFKPGGELQMAPGMKALHALRPPRTFFLSPDLIFGAGEWMRIAWENGWDGTGTLSLTLHAYAGGFTAFVPRVPSVCRSSSAVFPEESLPAGDWTEILPEFEQAAGVFFDKREADARAYLGIYTPDGRYPVQLPLADGLRQFLRRRRETGAARVMLATALGRHAPPMPLDAHLKLFENIAEPKRLSICCYCPLEYVKRLQRLLPNTYGLQAGEEGMPAYDSEDAFFKSKPYFIAQAAYQFPAHTHYGWIDMDYVKHPVHPSAVFVWDALADDRIHLAQVDGEMDTGLVVVPRGKMEWLLQTASVLSPDPALGAGDAGLFKCLADTYPEAFTLHPMEKKHMLLSLCQPLISGGMLHDA